MTANADRERAIRERWYARGYEGTDGLGGNLGVEEQVYADLAYLLDRVAELTGERDTARTAGDDPANVFVAEGHSTAQFYIGADTREEAEMTTLSVIWDKSDAMIAVVAPRNVVRFNIGHLKDVIAALASISERAAALADDGEAG